MKPIPFNRPLMADAAYEHLREAVRNGHLSGDGPFTKLCHSLLSEILLGAKVLLTTSCTHALEMAAILLDIQSGDEVVVPSFTFVSTVNAFVLRGARPIFADIRPDTLNLDEQKLPNLITPRTRVIVPVHYAGVGCEMQSIGKTAAATEVKVVEDNAHGLFGTYCGKPLGSFGALAAQSFHETKNLSCGEGGALVLNDRSLEERAEIIREKGTNRSRFFRGLVDKYTWVDIGSSYLPSDALAALLLSQLQISNEIQNRRMTLWATYRRELEDWAMSNRLGLPQIPDHCTHPAHLFYLILPTLEDRQAMLAHLRARGITATFHYVPLHLSEMGAHYGAYPGLCPVTEAVSDRLIRLPLYFDLSDADQARVINAVKSFRISIGREPVTRLLARLAGSKRAA